MFAQWIRSGIRAQITFIVIVGAVLTTAATLVIADTSINQYGDRQARAEANRNLRIAELVRKTTYGSSISISNDGPMGELVVDSPTINQQNYTTDPVHNNYGKLALNTDTSFVDQVRNLLNGAEVSVYQCQNKAGQPIDGGCPLISTTQVLTDGVTRDVSTPDHLHVLAPSTLQDILAKVAQSGSAAYPQTIGGVQFMVGYQLLYDPDLETNPANAMPIGVVEVAQPLTEINSLINTTTIYMILIGVLIMIAGIVVALIVASAISGTLQRASSQLNVASNQLTQLSNKQSGGSSQQAWAINAINRGLQSMQESSTDISHRTDQLAQVGTQVALRRAEITPPQLEAIMGFMTRSVREISISSHKHASTVERMSGAMEAVTEMADQVADSSRQMSESAQRLETVVSQLEELVTGRRRRPAARTEKANKMDRDSGMNRDNGMNMGGPAANGAGRGGMRTASGPRPLSLPDAARSGTRSGPGMMREEPPPPMPARPPMLPGVRSVRPSSPRESGMWDTHDGSFTGR